MRKRSKQPSSTLQSKNKRKKSQPPLQQAKSLMKRHPWSVDSSILQKNQGFHLQSVTIHWSQKMSSYKMDNIEPMFGTKESATCSQVPKWLLQWEEVENKKKCTTRIVRKKPIPRPSKCPRRSSIGSKRNSFQKSSGNTRRHRSKLLKQRSPRKLSKELKLRKPRRLRWSRSLKLCQKQAFRRNQLNLCQKSIKSKTWQKLHSWKSSQNHYQRPPLRPLKISIPRKR